jgi:O-antigen/teichoic acid export membrane protein
VLGFAAKIVYAARAFGIVPDPRRFERGRARALMGVSAWMFIINLANKVIWNTDTVVVGAVLGAIAVAHYAVALGPATAVRTVTDQFNSVTYSAAASLRAQDELAALRRLLLEATRVVTSFIGPFVVLFALWGAQFLRLWVGPSLMSSAATLVVLVIGMLSSSVQATATQILLAFELQRRMAVVAVAEAAANLICSVLLARTMGIEGVALGTTIPTTVTAFGYYLPKAARLLSIPLAGVLRRLVGPAALCAGAFLLFRFGVPALAFPSLPVFLVFAGLFIVVLVVAGVLLDREERGTYLGLVRAYRRQDARVRA